MSLAGELAEAYSASPEVRAGVAAVVRQLLEALRARLAAGGYCTCGSPQAHLEGCAYLAIEEFLREQEGP